MSADMQQSPSESLNLATILEMSAVAMPARPAITFEGETFSYTELQTLACRWADWLESRAVQRIAVMGENHIGILVLLLGAALGGCDVALINPRLRAHELSHALSTTEAPLLFTCSVRSDAPQQALVGLPFAVEQIEIGTQPPEQSDVRTEAQPHPNVSASRAGALQIFTSGTTSLPKAVVLEQEMLVRYLLASYEPLAAEPEEATLVAVPLFHIAGVMNAMSAIYSARRVVLLPRFDSRAWLEVARRERVTQAFLVPTMLRQIVGELQASPALRPDELRLLSYGGSPAAPKDILAALEMLPGVDFVGAFGLTETSSTIAILDADDHRKARVDGDMDRIASVGRPIPGVEIAIEQSDGMDHGSDGARGEILVRGPQVAERYLGGPSRTDASGWFHTGDIGYFDRDGYLYVAGRVDDMIQRGAENISPREIELAFEQHPDMAEVAAVGVPDAEWGEVVALVVVPRRGATLEESQLQRFAEERLAGFKRPERYIIATVLPRNALGKLLRTELRASLTSRAYGRSAA